jgi:hypothetical protein
MGHTFSALNISCSISGNHRSRPLSGPVLGDGKMGGVGKVLAVDISGALVSTRYARSTSREDSVILEKVSLVQKVTENLPLDEKEMTR